MYVCKHTCVRNSETTDKCVQSSGLLTPDPTPRTPHREHDPLQNFSTGPAGICKPFWSSTSATREGTARTRAMTTTTNGRCADPCFYCMGTYWRLQAYCGAARCAVTHSSIHTGPRGQPQAHTRNTSPTCCTTAVSRTTPETRSRADGSGLSSLRCPTLALGKVNGERKQ